MANWFINVDGFTSGPHPVDHVRHWVTHRQLPETTLFWPDGGSTWLPAVQAAPLIVGSGGPAPAPWARTAPTPGPVARPTAAPAPASTPLPAPSPLPQPSPGPAPGMPQHQGMPQPQGMHHPGAGPSAPTPAETSYPGHATYSAPYAAAYAPPQGAPHGYGYPAHQAQRGGLHAFADRLADFAGVERITGFRPRELMSLALRKHSQDELEQTFATGLPGFTPPLDKVLSDWPKPWIFVRLYATASMLFLGFVALVEIFENYNLLPGLLVVGSFAVPLSVLVLFFELNTPRNISLYAITRAFLIGGVISLAITLVLIQFGNSQNAILGPLLTGILEEVGKLLAVFVIALRMPGLRYPWILNGMLFGAAVGAGFAAFESAGYAMTTMLSQSSETGLGVGPAITVIFLRGALAPFGHVVWTALAAGALWRVKRDRGMSPAMLVDLRVLRVLAMVIALHAIWDFGVQLPFMLKYAALGVTAWVLVLGMVTAGLKQIKATQVNAARGGPGLPQATALQPSVPPVGSR